MPETPDTTLSFTRDLKASPANLWRCWTEAALVVQWFTPAPVKTTEAVVEPHPGGRFFTVMEIPGAGEVRGEGCVLQAEPGKRLIWTNCLSQGFVPQKIGTGDFDFGMTAEIVLHPLPDGCRYTANVLHATAEDAQKHRDMGFFIGWGAATAQLETLAASLG
jgi:uncharacterized protein YndB with AHSA1/START domain